jgi:predicted nucleic acid-binding protein
MAAMPDSSDHAFALIFDNTVLSNFASTERLFLLEQLYAGKPHTTLMVVEEVKRGIRDGYRYLHSLEEILKPLSPRGWLPILSIDSPEEQAMYVELSSSLGLGEASCLSVAISRGFVLATDDLAARREAVKRGVRLTGTLGILIRLVRERHLPLTTANDILRQMITWRYRSPVTRLDDLL